MKFTFVPDYRFQTFDLASAEFLSSIGAKGIVLDVDNTLEPYENPLPTEAVREWLESLKANGIRAAIVSNNDKERIELFNKDIGHHRLHRSNRKRKRILRRKQGIQLR